MMGSSDDWAAESPPRGRKTIIIEHGLDALKYLIHTRGACVLVEGDGLGRFDLLKKRNILHAVGMNLCNLRGYVSVKGDTALRPERTSLGNGRQAVGKVGPGKVICKDLTKSLLSGVDLIGRDCADTRSCVNKK